MMSLTWQRICLHLQKTHLLEQVTDHVLDEAAVQADLPTTALPLKVCQGSLTSVQLRHRKPFLLGSSSDVTVNTAQLYLINKDIDATELEAVKKLSAQSS